MSNTAASRSARSTRSRSVVGYKRNEILKVITARRFGYHAMLVGIEFEARRGTRGVAGTAQLRDGGEE